MLYTYECSASSHALEPTLVYQDLDRTAHGQSAYAELCSNRQLGREPISRLKLLLLDESAEDPTQLVIEWDRRLREEPIPVGRCENSDGSLAGISIVYEYPRSLTGITMEYRNDTFTYQAD